MSVLILAAQVADVVRHFVYLAMAFMSALILAAQDADVLRHYVQDVYRMAIALATAPPTPV
jgi:hypothetical protein